jgi:hypothetical protein
MSAILHFCSGKSLPITQKEFEQIAPKLQQGGIRLYRTGSKSLVPLNSNTIELIEYVDDVPVEIIPPKATPEPLPKIEAVEPPEAENKEISEKPIEEPVESPMDKMMRLSNCKHEPEKLELYRQHTAKGIRYFPLCSYCGKRERYVSESKIVKGEYEGTPNERWTAEDIANAKDWIDS